MANAGTVYVTFGADNREFKQVAKETVDAAQRAGEQAGAAWERAGQRGSKAVGGLNETLRTFAKEQSQQGRIAGRITSEISSLIPVSKEAQGVLTAFGGAALEANTGLFTLGAGLAVAGLAMAAYKLLTKDATEQLQRLNAEQAGNLKLLDTAAQKAANERILDGQSVFSDRGTAGKALAQQQEIAKYREAVGGLKGDLQEAQRKFVELQEAAKLNIGMKVAMHFTDAGAEVNKLSAALATAEAKLREVEKAAVPFEKLVAFRGLGLAASAGITSGEVAAWEKSNDKAIEAAREWQRAFAAAEKNFSLSAWQATKGVDLSQSQGGVLNLQQSTDSGRIERLGPDAMRSRLYDMRGMGQRASAGITGAQVGAADKQLEKERKRWEDLGEDFKRSISKSAGRAFKDIVSGAKDVGSALKDMFASIGESIVGAMMSVLEQWVSNMVQKFLLQKATAGTTNVATITSDAARGAAAAFASTAAIPVVGPALAPGAAAAAYGQIMAYAPMAAAEGGWRLPDSGGPFPMFGHEGERMLNKKQNRDYERLGQMAESGALGPGLTVNASFPGVYDRQGFRKQQRHFEREISQTMKRIKRGGKN